MTVSGLSPGAPYVHQFTANQNKCESIRVDFVVTALSGAATEGLVFNYWGLEQEASGRTALLGATQMS